MDFWQSCLIFLACMSDGETPQEAISTVQDAIESWIEAAREIGHTVPQPSSQAAIG